MPPGAAEVGNPSGYSWVRIFVAGVQRYAAVLADLLPACDRSPRVTAFAACVAQEVRAAAQRNLKRSLKQANARANAEAHRADEVDKACCRRNAARRPAEAGEAKANEQAGEYLRRIESAKAALGGAV